MPDLHILAGPFSTAAVRCRMAAGLEQLSGDRREATLTALRLRRAKLVRDLTSGLATEPGFEHVNLPDLAGTLITLLAGVVKSGWVDARTASLQDLARFAPPLGVRHLIRAVHHAERTTLGELSLEEGIGANAESWQDTARAIGGAATEIAGVLAETLGAANPLRDPLTTLLSPPVFEYVLGQETIRARRHRHGVALLLFDVDHFADINQSYGHSAGDWLLERLGVLSRQFFRVHDSVGRQGGDSIAVMLPETPFAHAASLARQFREMVRSRLVMVEPKTDATATVTLSAAVVGTDLVTHELDARLILAEAEAAIVRVQMNGRNSMEIVGVQPTTVTIPGAATLLGVENREIIRLLRGGELSAMRRARHLHIQREHLDARRHRS